MKASELIQELQKSISEHGDLEVMMEHPGSGDLFPPHYIAKRHGSEFDPDQEDLLELVVDWIHE